MYAYAKTIPQKDQLWMMKICQQVAESDERIQRIDALVATYDQLGTLTPIAQLDRSNLIAERATIKAGLVQMLLNMPHIVAANSR